MLPAQSHAPRLPFSPSTCRKLQMNRCLTANNGPIRLIAEPLFEAWTFRAVDAGFHPGAGLGVRHPNEVCSGKFHRVFRSAAAGPVSEADQRGKNRAVSRTGERIPIRPASSRLPGSAVSQFPTPTPIAAHLPHSWNSSSQMRTGVDRRRRPQR